MTSKVNTFKFIEKYCNQLKKDDVYNIKLMKCELLRLNTFVKWPCNNYPGLYVWPIKLAKSGFYYDARKNTTICYLCNLEKTSMFWKIPIDPMTVHIKDSPSCKIHNKKNFQGNIRFYSQMMKLQMMKLQVIKL